MSNETAAPQGNPGDIVNWPMLKIVYRTDPNKIAALLPPGIEPGANPNVNITIYNFPVPDEPEFGIVTSVDARFNGVDGEYTLGYGIDQESAIFVSQETNGQPKYPCTTDFYRLGPQVTARCVHFEAVVCCEAFEGKPTLARHRMVYATLGKLMGNEIHALGLRTELPEK